MDKSSQITTETLRKNIWRSIRILRRFSVPDLIRTIPKKVTESRVRRIVAMLAAHGIIKKTGGNNKGRIGQYQVYMLVKDSPETPHICENCGWPVFTSTFCKKKEKEKEKETQTGGAG